MASSYLSLIAAKCLRFIVKLVLAFSGAKKKPVSPIVTLYLDNGRSTAKEDVGSADKSRKGGAAPPVLVHVYLPTTTATSTTKEASSSSSAAEDVKWPVVVNLHGSGFLFHTFGEDSHFCQQVANEVNCVVLDVAYSKAPERPFPAASEDIDTVLDWIVDKTSQLEERLTKDKINVKIDSKRIAITGFSSGGNLALTACVRAKKVSRLEIIKAVVAFYPSTNLAESPYEKPQLRPAKGQAGAVLPPYLRKFLYHCYVPLTQSIARSADIISPINAKADDFPHSVTVITCEGDSLAREAQQMVEKMQRERSSEEGRKEEQETFQGETAINGFLWWDAKGQGHNWDKMSREGTEAAKLRDFAYDLTVERLKSALSPPPVGS